jgi:hypothetical protein
VLGVVVVAASGVEVRGTSVGRDKPGFVGGRVEVKKTDRVGAGVSSETLTQEPRLRPMSRSNIQIFFIRGILLGKYYGVPHKLLNFRFEFRSVNSSVMREMNGKSTVPKVSSETTVKPLKPSGRL